MSRRAALVAIPEPEPEPAKPGRFPLATITVAPTEGPLAGYTLRMRYPSVGFYIDRERGNLDDTGWYEEIVDAVEEHDLGRDIKRLPRAAIWAIGNAWADAMKALAIPPANGSS